MTHLGDITKIDWFHVPTVDVVTGGSPCQDLSVAGKRAGLAGERSGLYMEQIRCVKELRQADEQRGRTGFAIRPRYMVWENVPGAFSSNGGKDFAAVLEEAVKVVCPKSPPVPVPEGGWPTSGCLTDGVAGRWSIAWRVHDAQFWGVPQRRRRISVVCDFGGLSAPEILFERKGVSGDFEQSRTTREETAGGAGKSTESASGAFNPWDSQSARVYSQDGVWHSLNANENGGQSRDSVLAISFQERAGKPGGGKGILIQHEHVGALSTLNNQSVLCLNDQGGSVMGVSEDVTGALRAQEHGHQPVVATAYGISSYDSNAMKSSNPNSGIYEADTARTLDLNGGSPACNQGGIAIVNTYQDVTGTLNPGAHPGSYNGQDAYNDMLIAASLSARDYKGPCAQDLGNNMANYPIQNSVVRRLTPLECERLQGYPDGWTDIGEWVDSKGKRHKDADSPRYKALGNSIALPFWFWLLRRISAQYIGPATLGSLFDGISGFCYVWARCNGSKSCLWASEIEEFPIAVCKRHLGDEESGEVGDILEYL